jgi:hypothetical protein
MRNRHVPRVCGNCGAPMAGEEGRCWRCGVEATPEDAPPTTLRLVSDRGSLVAEASAPRRAVGQAR